jgi:hypothetical protein
MLRSLPVVFSNRQQEAQLSRSTNALCQLNATLEETHAAETVQVLTAVLIQQSVRNVGTLVAWSQHRPHHLFSMAAFTALAPQQVDPGTTVLSLQELVLWCPIPGSHAVQSANLGQQQCLNSQHCHSHHRAAGAVRYVVRQGQGMSSALHSNG